MKLKYYLRGIGIGMVVTAVIMSISFASRSQTMTDEEIKIRARELGMKESTILIESSLPSEESPEESLEEGSVESTEESTEEGSVESAEETAGVSSGDEAEERISDEDTQQASVEEPVESSEKKPIEEAEPSLEGELVRIEIRRGDTSVSVSEKLLQAGLIEDAGEYDRYLCANGYDKSIHVDRFDIPVGAGHEEIAKIITKRQ